MYKQRLEKEKRNTLLKVIELGYQFKMFNFNFGIKNIQGFIKV